MKRMVSFLLIILMLCLVPMVVMAINTPIGLYLNGDKIQSEIAPKVIDNYTYIDLHTIASEFGVEVNWDAAQKTATVKYENLKIEFMVGKSIALVNGNQNQLIAAPFMSDENVFVPLQFLGDQLGIKVNWDKLTSSVMLYKKDKSFLSSKVLFELDQNTVLPTEMFESDGSEQLSSLSSIQIINNQISLQFDALVSPVTFYLSDPHRFVVDLPFSKLSSSLAGQGLQQSGEIDSAHPVITKIRYAMHDATTVRLVIDLSKEARFNIIENINTNQLTIQLVNNVYKIVIDPGHGGKDPGAEGPSGKYEKQFTLDLSHKIQKLLDKEPNLQGYMTRTEDTFISLDDRVLFANDLNADLFISLHGNTFTSPISGTESFYWHRESMNFASIMHNYAVEGAQLPDRRLRKMEYRVLRDTHMPAVLLELGYLSNAQEENTMLSEEFQNRVAASIVKGIKHYLEIN